MQFRMFVPTVGVIVQSAGVRHAVSATTLSPARALNKGVVEVTANGFIVVDTPHVVEPVSLAGKREMPIKTTRYVATDAFLSVVNSPRTDSNAWTLVRYFTVHGI